MIEDLSALCPCGHKNRFHDYGGCQIVIDQSWGKPVRFCICRRQFLQVEDIQD